MNLIDKLESKIKICKEKRIEKIERRNSVLIPYISPIFDWDFIIRLLEMILYILGIIKLIIEIFKKKKK
jgi:hypothetical protein